MYFFHKYLTGQDLKDAVELYDEGHDVLIPTNAMDALLMAFLWPDRSWKKIYDSLPCKIEPIPADFVWPMVSEKVEPKVGQVWECVNNVMPPYEGNPDYFSHKFTIGKRYKLKALTPYKYWHIDDDRGVDVGIDVDGRDTKSPIHLSKFFRFVSEPADKLKMQSNVDPAISFGGNGTGGTTNNYARWANDMSEAHSSVVIDPMKHENEGPTVDEFLAKVQPDFDLYSKLDDAGKKVMRENYPNVEFPKVKEYVKSNESDLVWVAEYTDNIARVQFRQCQPEISGNEIRFVKEV
jgi:hypothetical protein